MISILLARRYGSLLKFERKLPRVINEKKSVICSKNAQFNKFCSFCDLANSESLYINFSFCEKDIWSDSGLSLKILKMFWAVGFYEGKEQNSSVKSQSHISLIVISLSKYSDNIFVEDFNLDRNVGTEINSTIVALFCLRRFSRAFSERERSFKLIHTKS